MIPLNDTEPNRYTSFPFMTAVIICLNILILGVEDILVETDMARFMEVIQLYGTVPSLTLSRQGGGALSAVTHMFLHGGIFHLFGNMLGLWVFGRRVEDVCGPWRFLFFYLVCGLFANVVSTVTQADSTIPGIGASGALYGVMAAYLMIFPKGRIRTVLIAGIVPFFFKIRAYWIILYFILLEIPPALRILIYQADYQVGHWAHLGGFFGGLFVFLFLRADAFHRYRNELPL